jgi:diguanylate cyclase (GGDEF)-like protein
MSDPSDRDALTGLYNQRFFRDAQAREVARARRHRRPLALIVFDVDEFKSINDEYGHAPGDTILAGLAGRLRGLARASDIACRIGGDEFAVILPESGLEDAQDFWARCRDMLAGKPYEYVGAISLSCGIAEFEAEEDATAFFSRVDLALHQAKATGKGEMVIAAPPAPQALERASRSGSSMQTGWTGYTPPFRQHKWEYWIEEGEPNIERLNELGSAGWELIAAAGSKLIFKRQRRRGEPPPPEEGAGVREPRRPKPSTGGSGTSKPLSDDA